MAYARIETNDSIWDTYIGLKPLYGGPSPLHLSQNTNKNFQLQLEVIFGVCVYIYIFSGSKAREQEKKDPLGGGHHPKILLTTQTVKSPAEEQWTPTPNLVRMPRVMIWHTTNKIWKSSLLI